LGYDSISPIGDSKCPFLKIIDEILGTDGKSKNSSKK
jgi:hypothetical protein